MLVHDLAYSLGRFNGRVSMMSIGTTGSDSIIRAYKKLRYEWSCARMSTVVLSRLSTTPVDIRLVDSENTVLRLMCIDCELAL